MKIAREAIYSVSLEDQGKRLDVFLSEKDKELSRNRIQYLIKNGFVEVNKRKVKCSYKVKANDKVYIAVPEEEPLKVEPQAIDFEIIYEDSYVAVINKPAGIVIHPAPGHYSGTLVHGLLYRCKDLSGIGGVLRPGIVHRLDKDTSGIMVIAKNDFSHKLLSEQFKEGLVEKEYWVLVQGPVKEDEGVIDLPIGRHPNLRTKMTVSPSGRKAVTFWKKISELPGDIVLISAFPKTGRTHQIRVHLSHIGYPVLGDNLYGKIRKDLSIPRQMLHSKRIAFYHPYTGKKVEFSANLPEDMKNVILELEDLTIKNPNNKIFKKIKNPSLNLVQIYQKRGIEVC